MGLPRRLNFTLKQYLDEPEFNTSQMIYGHGFLPGMYWTSYCHCQWDPTSTLDGPLVCLVLTVAHRGYAELACTEPASLAAMAVMMSHGLLTTRMVAFLGIVLGKSGKLKRCQVVDSMVYRVSGGSILGP